MKTDLPNKFHCKEISCNHASSPCG